MINNSHNKGILVDVGFSILTNTRQDKAITAEVFQTKKLKGKAGKWIKTKIPDSFLTGVRNAANAGRDEVYLLTVPWIRGHRFLRLSRRPEFLEKMVKVRERFQKEVQKFIDAWPQAIAEARVMHGETFDENDYPKATSLAAEFDMTVDWIAVPTQDQFVETVMGSAHAELEAQFLAAEERRHKAVINDVWNRLAEPIQKLADTLASPEKVFRDTIIGNVRDMVALAPDLNIADNPTLTKAIQEIDTKLSTLDPEGIRSSAVLRRAAVSVATDIVDRYKRKFTL
jgi:hypothetical protein